MRKRIISTALSAGLLLGLAPCAHLLAQDTLTLQDTLKVRMVEADSLVKVMRMVSGKEIFIAVPAGDESVYTVMEPLGKWVGVAYEKLSGGGYVITKHGERTYLMKGNTIKADLPLAYFQKESRQSDQQIAVRTEEALYLNKVYEIGDEHHRSTASKVTINGHVRDVASGEAVPGISVIDKKTGSYSITDNYGAWRLTLPTGGNTLSFSGFPMEDMDLEVIVYNTGTLEVNMKEKVTTIKEASVSAEAIAYHRSAKMGLEKIQFDRIKKIPAAFGESDLIKAVLALPGVQSVGEASSGFNVRGGSVDQNLILLNDGVIFNPNHIFGIFSAFNSEVISGADLYKSSIPAQYGGRISSVLDIRTRDGNSKKVTGSLGLGLLTSRLELEGPIVKDKTTFILGGRTTYSNWILGLLPEDSSYHGGKTSFQDLNASVTHKFSTRSTLSVYGYYSRDKFSFSSNTDFKYSNLGYSARFRQLIGDLTTMEVSAGRSEYDNVVNSDMDYDFGAYTYKAFIGQTWGKLQFKHQFSLHNTLVAGFDANHYSLLPGTMVPYGAMSGIREKALPSQGAIEGSVFVNDTWDIGERLSLDFGLRYGMFYRFKDEGIAGGKFYHAPELRFSGKYSFRDDLTFKAGFNTLRQNIHLITNTSTISPMDSWHLSSPDIRPQDGYQVAGGVYYSPMPNVDLSLEAYFKRYRNALDYKSGATLIMNEQLSDELIPILGQSFGVELMAKKTVGKLNGWVSYTYSRALLRDTREISQFPINGGNWYNAPHDKPHSLKVAANYKFTHRYSASMNVEYATGRPITVPIGTYWYGGMRRIAYSDRNSHRIEDYFRLDLAMNVEPGHYLRQLAHMSFTFGVYNVTARKNAYSVYYTIDSFSSTGVPEGYKISVFAYPIPYINLNLVF